MYLVCCVQLCGSGGIRAWSGQRFQKKSKWRSGQQRLHFVLWHFQIGRKGTLCSGMQLYPIAKQLWDKIKHKFMVGAVALSRSDQWLLENNVADLLQQLRWPPDMSSVNYWHCSRDLCINVNLNTADSQEIFMYTLKLHKAIGWVVFWSYVFQDLLQYLKIMK